MIVVYHHIIWFKSFFISTKFIRPFLHVRIIQVLLFTYFRHELWTHVRTLPGPLVAWFKLTKWKLMFKFWNYRLFGFWKDPTYFCLSLLQCISIHFNKLERPLNPPPFQRCFVPSLVEIGPMVLEIKMKKFYNAHKDDKTIKLYIPLFYSI